MSKEDTVPAAAPKRPTSASSRAGKRLWTAAVLAVVVAVIGGIFLASARRESTPSKAHEVLELPWFEDVIATSDVGFEHDSGQQGDFWFPEIVIGGVGLFDYDGDGYLDIYLVQGGSLDPSNSDAPGNKLYRNLGDWTFEDVTATAGVGDTGYGMGCACGDYDGDGDVDLYVTNLGPNVLYRNDGNGTFTDVTATAGVGDASWSASCAFVDVDSDGNLDLMVVNYIGWSHASELECPSYRGRRDYCSPKNYNSPARDTLYRNAGNGVFVDVTMSAGLGRAFGNGLGIACADYNQDGRLDLYVANDGTANQLWINQGGLRFTDEAMMSGCALNHYGWAEAGMGVAAVDLENDGDVDLFLSHLQEETNTLYVNTDTGFEDVTATVGLAVPSLALTGFGLGFADFDHSGRLDVYVANGRVKDGPNEPSPSDRYAEPNQVFRGLPDRRFEEVMPRGGTSSLLLETSRGAALGDLDNDGDVDIVVVNKDARPHLLRNIAGSRGNWVMFRVLNRRGTYALGAMVHADAGGRSQWRIVQRAYSYCASNDPRVHFGLGAIQQVTAVTVHWPNGAEESFGPFAAGQLYELHEGLGRKGG